MARDKETMYNYYENVPYGDDSHSHEVFGPISQEIIERRIKNFVTANSAAIKTGDMEMANKTEKAVYNTHKEVANADKSFKQEHAMTIDSISNWSDTHLMDKVCTEHPDFKGISFREDDGKIVYNVFDDRIGMMVAKTTEDFTKEFVEIGDWMRPKMEAKQKLIKARNDRGNPPPFDIPYFVNGLLKRNWKSMLTDVDETLDPNDPRSNGYRLQLVLNDAADENGGVLPEDYNLDKESFNPDFDTRLFASISDELWRAFDPNYKSPKDVSNSTAGDETASKENAEAENLMSRMNTEQKA